MYKQTEIKLETSSVPNEVFCTGCMSSDRILRRLDDLTAIFARITEDIIEVNNNIMLCWECVALLRRVNTFRKNVSAVQRMLSYYYDYENPPQTLSKLTIEHFDTENLIETKPSVEETYLTNEGENNLIEGTHTTIEGKYPSIEGKNITNEGMHTTIEGKNPSMEGRYSSIEGKDTSNEGKYPSIEDKNTSNESKYSLIEGIAPTVVQVKEETDCMDDIFNDGCSIDFGIELKDVQDIKEELQHLVKPKKKRNFQSNNLPLYRLIKLPKRQCVIVKRKIEQSEINYWLEQDRNSPYYRAASAKCESCAKVLVGSCRRGHAKSKHDIKKYTNPHICDICQSIYSMKSSLAKHIKDHYYIYVCTTCDFSCASINNMKSHVKVQAKRRLYYCLECPGVFTIRKLFYKHYKEEHTLFICDHCNTQFKCKSRLIRHITLQHSSGICTICNIDFKLYRYLRAHMRRIHEYAPSEANYCATCDRQYSNDQRFKVHIMNSIAHSKERRARKREEKVQCPECPKIYQRRSFMMNHYRLVHLKKTNYYCTICEKYFLTNTRLKQHTREKHEGLGPVKNKLCYLCGRGFATNRILNNHIRTHTGERPFHCDFCDAKFAQKVARNSHVKYIHKKMRRNTAHGQTKP